MTVLRATEIKKLPSGKHHDGGGLYLVVAKSSNSRKWVLRGTVNGKRREWGLGAASDISLADVRDKAASYRKKIRNGVDPAEEIRLAKATYQAKEQENQIPPFKEAAVMVHEEHLPSWRNVKHGKQWLSSMEQHVFPKLGDIRVDRVTGPEVRDLLIEIWLVIPETARRVRQRIGVVLDYAHAKGWREQEAPMRSVSKGLPKQPNKKKHYPAMPWQDVPDFITNMPTIIKASDTVMATLEFTILTAARSGEVRGMTWGEIDLDAKVWAIPAERMKAEVEHRVPLSDRAIEILTGICEGEDDALIFTGRKKNSPLSDMTLTMPLRRAGLGITVHGFRSSFRDWCNEATNTPRAIAERCLAHAIEGKTEAAYSRTDFLDKRREVMQLWSDFCGSTENVTQIRRVK
jgi:integrase